MRTLPLALSAVLVASQLSSASSARADSDWHTWVGISVIGAGAILVGASVLESSHVRSLNDDPTFTSYRARFPSSQDDVCAHARAGDEGPSGASSQPLAAQAASICDRARSSQRLEYVFLGLGAAAIVGGTIVLVTRPSHEAKRTAVRVQPWVARDGGGALLRVTF